MAVLGTGAWEGAAKGRASERQLIEHAKAGLGL